MRSLGTLFQMDATTAECLKEDLLCCVLTIKRGRSSCAMREDGDIEEKRSRNDGKTTENSAT